MKHRRPFLWLTLAGWLGLVAFLDLGNAHAPRRPLGANGDGYGDLAVGTPHERIGPAPSAGTVNLLFGAKGGLTEDGSQLWYQDVSGIADTSEENDLFGQALTTGDFNGDGYGDLAVGAPGEEIDGKIYAGAVTVLYGTSGGLTTAGSQFWHQDSPLVLDSPEVGDVFGSALAAADFDGDGYDDLAVGARHEGLGAANVAGAVNVLYGSSAGLASAGNQLWHQDSPGILDGAEALDNFGAALAAGDFDGDGYADLAVGVPFETIDAAGPVIKAGAVHVLYGSSIGLAAGGNQFWHQNSPGSADAVEEGDRFGLSLAAGDFNGDGDDDLAVGVPEEDLGQAVNAGAVQVLYGSSGGLSVAGNQLWSQEIPGIGGTPGTGDQFGAALAGGDFDGDGYDDLAAGVPFEWVDGVEKAGAVNVLYGSAAGLSEVGDQFWHQDSDGVDDALEARDFFGRALAACDFDGDGFADLAIGVPFEDVGGMVDGGAVNVLYGTLGGVAATGNQLWHQDSPGIGGAVETNDRFGTYLACSPRAPRGIYLPLVVRTP